MKHLGLTYAAPRPGALVTGDVVLDIPDSSSPSQTLWCEGLAIARLDIHAYGFVTIHLRSEESLHIYICVHDIPDGVEQLLSLYPACYV